MTALREGEFSLDGFPFGGEGHDIVVLPRGFRPGGWATQSQDVTSTTGDHIVFGRDRTVPAAWSWDLATNAHEADGALTALDDMAFMWASPTARGGRGDVSVLRYRLGGRDRRVYGRPRRFTPVLTQTLWAGITAAIAEFQPVESVTYDDAPRSIEVNSQTPRTGGLIAPFVAPFTTSQTATVDGSIGDVGGRVPTPPIITIYGPITRPFVSGPGWRIDLDTTVPAGAAVIIDAHPSLGTVVRNDGASLAGTLSLHSRLSRVRLFPGSSHITFGGVDPSGTARCNVAWHPAHPSI